MESRRLFETGSGRIRWAGLAIGLLFALVGARLFELQVLRGEAYETLASENRISIRLMEPLRGRVLDRKGRVLAEDRPRWIVTLNFHELIDPATIAGAVARAFGEDEARVARAVGTGWGDAYAPQVRELRRDALLRLLDRLGPVVGRSVPELVAAVRAAEDEVLERECDERVRVAGLLLEGRKGSRAEIRKAVREAEEALLEAMRASVPEGEFLLATGIRWNLEMAARRERLAIWKRIASETGRVRKDLDKRLLELDRGCARRMLAAMRSRDHVLVEGEFGYGAVARLEMDWNRFPGVSVRAIPARLYPAGEAACHVVGYVGYLGWTVRKGEPVNLYEEKESADFFFGPLSAFLDREDYEGMERLGAFHRDLFGKAGVERLWDGELRGLRGARIVERDRRNRVQRNLRVHPPENGTVLRLTIDAKLQAEALDAFACAKPALPPGAEVRGAAVVLDANTGAVLALVSVPGYDPEAMTPPVSAETARAVLRGPGKPLLNRAVSGQYPAGSTFKIVCALAALEEGIVEPGTKLECTGVYEYGDRKFRCWNRWGHGPVDLHEALEQSCNVYFYILGRELGDSLARWAGLFGFASVTGVDLPGEKSGELPRGRGGDWVQLAIGQRMTATPLQVARMAAAVGNGGRFLEPFLLEGGGRARDFAVPLVSPASLKAVQEGMVRVVHGEHGTASLPSLIEARAAGKTGTAETGRKVDGVYTNHAWFAGYAPYDDPHVAVAVVIEDVPEGVHGGEAAAPVAGAILKAALEAVGHE